ncbi:hypothetical protein KHA80_04200 [Anaerobacillus sp. HL2]|nr:hypothetical protein KHA80_04200 [Anaerobacillus sp. HL2]
MKNVSSFKASSTLHTIGIYDNEKITISKNGDLPFARWPILALRENAYDKNYGFMISGEGEINLLIC